MSVLSVVWFKRDLRVQDAQPLSQAASVSKILPLYCIEPDYWQQPYTSARQWAWISGALLELDAALTDLGQPLCVESGDVVAVFEALWQGHRFSRLW